MVYDSTGDLVIFLPEHRRLFLPLQYKRPPSTSLTSVFGSIRSESSSSTSVFFTLRSSILHLSLLSRVLAAPRLASSLGVHCSFSKVQPKQQQQGLGEVIEAPSRSNYTHVGSSGGQQEQRHECGGVKMMGVLKVVLPVLGMVQIVLAFLYADPGFQTMVSVSSSLLAVVNEIAQQNNLGWVQTAVHQASFWWFYSPAGMLKIHQFCSERKPITRVWPEPRG